MYVLIIVSKALLHISLNSPLAKLHVMQKHTKSCTRL